MSGREMVIMLMKAMVKRLTSNKTRKMKKNHNQPVMSNWKFGTGTLIVEIYKFLCFLCQPGASHQNSGIGTFYVQ